MKLEVKVSAASVETGDVVAEGEFKVLTETGNASLAARAWLRRFRPVFVLCFISSGPAYNNTESAIYGLPLRPHADLGLRLDLGIVCNYRI